jgi:hypothetical protein
MPQNADKGRGLCSLDLKPYDKFTTRSMVYVPEYDIQLPKAPAFREMGAVEIKRLVARLSRPIQCLTISLPVTNIIFHLTLNRPR